MDRGYPNESITENGQNTEKSPGDLRRHDVTRAPVKNYRLILIWKILKELIITIIINNKKNKGNCPMNGMYNLKNIVYHATIIRNENLKYLN